MGGRARLFVAAWLPGEVRDALAAVPRPELDGLRWVPAENWHVTLRFLGTAGIDDVVAALAAATYPAATIRLGPEARTLNRRHLVLPVHGADALAAAVRDATVGIGAADDRPFRGHLTIGRAKGDRIPRVDLSFAATFDVEQVALVRSTTGSDGPVYETVASFAVETSAA